MDGVPDGVETAQGSDPNDPDDFMDMDMDGTPDFLDDDADNDGISNEDESGGLDPFADTDGDGVPAYLDDDDNDPMVGNDDGAVEAPFDPDGNGVADFQDPNSDSDGDGVPTAVEVAEGTDPNDPADFQDTDGDGTPDLLDDDIDNDGVPNEDEFGGNPYVDADMDGIPAYLDDDDNDPTVGNEDLAVQPEFDSNGDGTPDGQDPNSDTDMDGVPDGVETAQGSDPNDPNDFMDMDGDGVPDFSDPDADNDGISNEDESGGLDPFADVDGDGVPAYLDDDDNDPSVGDDDGVVNPAFDADGNGIADFQDAGSDSDGDGVPNEIEIVEGTDPNDGEDFLDTDGNGVADFVELSDPAGDPDGDGVTNAAEVGGLAYDDLDGDGTPAYLDDDDNDPATGNEDGLIEVLYDFDRNGVLDGTDVCIPELDLERCPDVVPSGYFYSTTDGRILTGGSVEIVATQPAGLSGRGVAPPEFLTTADGTPGYYKFYAGQNGEYTVQITPPPGLVLNLDILNANAGTFEMPNDGSDVVLGQNDADGDGFLDGFNPATASADNPFFFSFAYGELRQEGQVLLNNVPVLTQSDVNLACIAEINLPLNDSCGATVLPDMVLTGEFNGVSSEAFDIVVMDGDTTNGPVVDGCGRFIYTVSVNEAFTDVIQGFDGCWGYVNAEDKTPLELVATPPGSNDLLCVDVEANSVSSLPASVSRCYTVDGQTGAVIDMAPELSAVLSPDAFDATEEGELMLPTFYDGCASTLEVCVSDVVENSSDGCGATSITRYFTARIAEGCEPANEEEATDESVRTSFTMTFNRPGLAALVMDSIPQVVEIEACATLNAPLDFLPEEADYPFLRVGERTISVVDANAMCSMIAVGYETSQNPIQTCPSTVKFQRTFTVVDWCAPTEVMTYTQLVKVGDGTGPEITGPIDSVYGTNVSGECAAIVRLDRPGVSMLDGCSGTAGELSVTIFPAGDVTQRGYGAYAIDMTNGVAEVSDPLPVGAYTFNYTATDECGNVSTLSVPFEVVDGQTPTMVCEDGLNVSLGLPLATATLTPEEVNAGSLDDCSGTDLTYGLAYSDDMSVVPTDFSDELNFSCADLGVQFVTLRGTDEAGNVNTCWLEVLVELKDSTGLAGCVCDPVPPVPICEQVVTTVLEMNAAGDSATATVFAANFIGDPLLDCSGNAVTKFGIVRSGEGPAAVDQASLTVSCDDFSDFVSVEVYAFDDAGTEPEFCTALIEVQAGDGVTCGEGGNLVGNILSQRSAPVTNVEVTLTGANDMDAMAMSDEAGTFRFERVPFGVDYTVQPDHLLPVDLQEVKVSDVVAISRVILGTAAFESGYDYVAADVDQNGRLNVLDMVAIQRVILGLDATYRTGQTWRFVSEDHELTTDGWFEAFPEVYNANDLQANVLDADFVGVELGNVVTGGRASLELETEDARLESGQTHVIELSNEELAGWQGTLRFGRDLEVLNVDHDGVGGLNAAYLSEGLLGVLLRESGDLRVTVRALNPVLLSESVELTDELVVQEGVPVAGGSGLLGLAFNGAPGLGWGPLSPTTRQKNALYQNVPNPVLEVTTISYSVAKAGTADFIVRDNTGRIVLTRSVEAVAGDNQITVRKGDLGAAGVYTYTLMQGDFAASRKLVLVR